MRVCIIGSGLSSLALAKALVNQKIYVHLFEKKKIKVFNKSRTLGISKSNVEFFNKNIMNINQIIWKLKKIEIFSENLKNEKLLNFENGKEELFSVVKNYQLFKLLNQKLNNEKFFKRIFSRKELSDFKEYDLVINTNYSNSITKKFFSKKIIKKYNSRAYTTLIKHKKISNHTAVQIFTRNGPLAFLPISENETSIVYSFDCNRNKNQQNIKELIKKYNPKYKIENIKNIESFELTSLTLRSYFHDNILAFGDLLHKIHPLAGQGFNMTIRDIKIFINLIKKRCDLGLPLDYSINKEFESNIKHKNFIFLSGIDFVHEFFNLERKTKNNLLSKSVQFIGKNNYINKLFINAANNGIL
tara:strand:- start:135 stop:1208 length:1074 start_codon:yes stop_codon:yes gene_type:complete